MPYAGLLFAQEATRTVFEWGRIQDRVDWVLPLAIFAGILLYVRWMYRRDSVEIGPWRRRLLTSLRLAAFLGLLVVYLQPQWRTERDVTTNSRVLLLVDTSLSMGLADEGSPSQSGGASRADAIADSLAGHALLDELRKRHDVSVIRFDEDTNTLATLPKQPAAGAGIAPDAPIKEDQTAQPPLDWRALLAPRGPETRLGQSLRDVLLSERATPVAGLVIFTDGGQNAGLGPQAIVPLARESGVPLFPIGLGSDKAPGNIRIGDLVAPMRAYPGDSYSVTGYVQSQGLTAQSIQVELLSRPADVSDAEAAAATRVEATEEVLLGAEGELVPVKFDLTPDATGRRTLILRADVPEGDSVATDNEQQADVEIVDQKTRVLLVAGGPSREYSFLRAMLFRDKNVTLDVLLQTARPGISQDAAKILDNFPTKREEMFQYDVVVAFDPDWTQLRPEQVELLEQWVAEQAGGLIALAGPVNTHRWAPEPTLAKLRDLYPVEFQRRFSLLDDGRFGSEEPWPLRFTREGLDADFLWIDESAMQSKTKWEEFPGVYGYYSVRGAKPGATVYASYSDPQAADGGKPPVYMCGQFYGSGRVFYLGSGEMWRLREVDEALFERFYTKLVRYVSQGRLLRGSSRGVLLVERDRYLLGQTVSVRAQVTNEQLEPLEVPSLTLRAVAPDGTSQAVNLQPDPTRAGTYAGQFTVRQEGAYQLDLPIDQGESEKLSRRIQVRVPDLERENPQRNDALLTELAQATGGHYFVGVNAAVTGEGWQPLPTLLKDRSRTMPVSEAPRSLWDNAWLLAIICGLLSLEWLFRRLSRLA
ncbi:MAG: VWA domain-containing protein [Pirellulales bacterium]|nr:VWA domain-containing protein [Pirellulales bacterium]